jgi:hypothetical protein
MRAKQEYDKWCALERMHEESRFGAMQQRAYIAGFNKAIELVEQSLKGEVYERTERMAQVQSSRSYRTPEERVPLCRGN